MRCCRAGWFLGAVVQKHTVHALARTDSVLTVECGTPLTGRFVTLSTTGPLALCGIQVPV
eukprot:6456242-Amphidinium_carterae.1